MTTEEVATENASANPSSAAATTGAVNKPAAPGNRPTVHKLDFQKDVVYLYQFCRSPTLPSPSPFCLKVETWLRMAGITYENIDTKLKYKSKKGQLPFVEVNGQEIADSEIIIKDLSTRFNKDLDVDLTSDQKNVSHAFISMLNNHTSWVFRFWRYSHPGQFLKTAQLDVKKIVNYKLPKGLLNFFFKLGLKSHVKQAVGHGLGRHSSEEIYEFGKNDLKALSQFLAEKPYFFGEEAHLLDCVAFCHICQFIYVPFDGMKEFLESECANLIQFVERIKERYWRDWDEMCKTLEMNTHIPKPVEEKKPEEPEKKEEGKENEKGSKEKIDEIDEIEKEKEKEKEKEEKEAKKEDEVKETKEEENAEKGTDGEKKE